MSIQRHLHSDATASGGGSSVAALHASPHDSCRSLQTRTTGAMAGCRLQSSRGLAGDLPRRGVSRRGRSTTRLESLRGRRVTSVSTSRADWTMDTIARRCERSHCLSVRQAGIASSWFATSARNFIAGGNLTGSNPQRLPGFSDAIRPQTRGISSGCTWRPSRRVLRVRISMRSTSLGSATRRGCVRSSAAAAPWSMSRIHHRSSSSHCSATASTCFTSPGESQCETLCCLYCVGCAPTRRTLPPLPPPADASRRRTSHSPPSLATSVRSSKHTAGFCSVAAWQRGGRVRPSCSRRATRAYRARPIFYESLACAIRANRQSASCRRPVVCAARAWECTDGHSLCARCSLRPAAVAASTRDAARAGTAPPGRSAASECGTLPTYSTSTRVLCCASGRAHELSPTYVM